MKLTKDEDDDFKELLKNHNRLLEIVERLKKRIEKDVHECDCEYGDCYHSYAAKLQKILEGKE